MAMEKTTIMMDNNRIPSSGERSESEVDFASLKMSHFPPDFSDMMGFVSIDNRPEFFIDLLNSSYLNDTFMYNVSNVSSNSLDEKGEEASTIEFVLMSLVTVLLGLLILITIIGKNQQSSSVASNLYRFSSPHD